jgi:hypothetical protein
LYTQKVTLWCFFEISQILFTERGISIFQHFETAQRFSNDALAGRRGLRAFATGFRRQEERHSERHPPLCADSEKRDKKIENFHNIITLLGFIIYRNGAECV